MTNLVKKLKAQLHTLQLIDTLEVNKFLYNKFKYHILNTKTIFTALIAICVISFSILSSQSVYFFIPQTTVGTYASFLLFVLIVSILTFTLYPLLIIYIVNAIAAIFNNNSSWLRIKLLVKTTTLIAAFIVGINLVTQNTINNWDKTQIICAWIFIYMIIVNRYLYHTHKKSIHNNTAIILICGVVALSFKPFFIITTHTLESLNITNINPQVYLPWQNCELLKNFNLTLDIAESNDILYNQRYYTELKNSQGCFIYGNTIRYSFGYDYTLMVKRNIRPLIDNKGVKYNSYVRLNCFAGNCYSDNNLQYKAQEDIFANLIKDGEKLDHTF